MIEIVPASQLKVGDVFSTDGGTVTNVVREGFAYGPLVHVTVLCHGTVKREALAPDFPCPLYREENEALLERIYGVDRPYPCVHGHFDCAQYERGPCANEEYAKGVSASDSGEVDLV